MPDTDSSQKNNDGTRNAAPPPSSPLPEKHRRELWLYIAVSIVAVELLVTVGAVFYGFIAGAAASQTGFSFPWLSWGAIFVMAPTLILLAVHFADVGLFRVRCGADTDQDWQQHLPERMQRLYRIVKGAPAVVVLLGIIVLGAALMTLDGALKAIGEFGSALVPYLPHIVGGIACVACVVILSVVWLNYRTRRLYAEYEFRREVLEKTGVIIVDKGSMALPPGGTGETPYALTSGEAPHRPALPGGSAPSSPRDVTHDITPNTTPDITLDTSFTDSDNTDSK